MNSCPKCRSKDLSMEHGWLVCNDCLWKEREEREEDE